MSRRTSPLLQGGLILTATTAFLYAAHNARNNGFLGVFRLDPDALEQNLHNILYQGFLLVFPVAFKVFAYCVAAACLYSFLFIPILQANIKSKRLYLKVKHFCFGKEKRSKWLLKIQKATLGYTGVVVLMLLLITKLASFERDGAASANKIFKTLESSVNDLQFITLKVDNEHQRLALLSCGSKNCAGINPRSKKVYYFGHREYSYIQNPKKPKKIPQDKVKCKYGAGWLCLDSIVQAMSCKKPNKIKKSM